MKQAEFMVVKVIGKVVYIVDGLGLNPRLAVPSVTNDAERVVQRVLKDYPGHRIVYKDTEGIWDELVYDTRGNVRFAPWEGWCPGGQRKR